MMIVSVNIKFRFISYSRLTISYLKMNLWKWCSFFKFDLVNDLLKIPFSPSGPGCRAGPSGRVFQRRPVLHSRISHLCRGTHLWWVCSEECGESQEEDSRQPLRSHRWAGSTGEDNRSIAVSPLFFYHVLFVFSVLTSHISSVLRLHRSALSSRTVCWSSSRAASVKELRWSVEAKLWAWRGSSLSPLFSLMWGTTCASPERRYDDKEQGYL